MAINQNNATRIIANSPSVGGSDYTFNLSVIQIIISGLTQVKISTDDINNNLVCEITAVGDLEKDEYVSNGWGIKAGDIEFFNFVDGGAGLPATATVDLGIEAEAQADYATWVATQTIEIITSTY